MADDTVELPCPMCLGRPETPQMVNVGQTGYPPRFVVCSHPCHSEEARRDDLVTQMLAYWDHRHRTHSGACWQWHPECTVAILGAEIKRLRTALEVCANHMSMTGAPQTTIDAIRKAVRGG